MGHSWGHYGELETLHQAGGHCGRHSGRLRGSVETEESHGVLGHCGSLRGTMEAGRHCEDEGSAAG